MIPPFVRLLAGFDSPSFGSVQRMRSVAFFFLLAAGCASSPWQHQVIYNTPGVVLYRESKYVEGARVPLGFTHPVQVAPEKVALLMNQLAYRKDSLLRSQSDYIFTQPSIAASAEPIALALGALDPDERLRFFFRRESWQEVLLGPHGTTGVMFCTAPGTLDVAFDRIDQRIQLPEGNEPAKVSFPNEPTEIVDDSPVLPAPGFETRTSPDGQIFPRWLMVRLEDLKPPAPQPAPQQAPAPRVQVAVPERPPLDGEGTPAAPPAAPAAAAAAGAAAAKPAAATDPSATPPAQAPQQITEERYQKARQRLETLNRLRKEGVITEAQYQEEYVKVMADL